jgi:predicted nicotinamide N-methyase
VLSAYLSSLRGPNHTIHLPVLESLLAGKENASINALELGAGCGIVGITLGTAFRDVTRKILLTDLSEASEILEHNLSLSTLSRSKISHKVLDWSEPLPEFVQKEIWNLVLVADCTYNPDFVPDLVGTLKRVQVGNEGVLILLAMKVRHDSEMVFFELMANEGFVVVEKGKVPLGVMGAEEEEIEIYVFR